MRRGWVLVGVVVLGGCGSSPLGSGGPDSAADAGLDAAGPDAAGDGPAAEHAIDAPLDAPSDVPDGGGAPDGGGLCQIGGSDGGASYPRGMRLRSVARAGDPLLADVDGDGLLDSVGFGVAPNPLAWSVFRNDGTGVFLPAAPRPPDVTAAMDPWVVADLDGDRHADGILVSSSGSPPYNMMVFRGGSGGTMSAVDGPGVTRAMGGRRLGAPVVADFDHDGLADVAYFYQPSGSTDGISVGVLAGSRSQVLAAPLLAPTGLVSSVAIVQSTAAGDIDGDGKPDLLLMYTYAGTMAKTVLLRGNGNGTFGAPEDVPSLPVTAGVWLHDVDGDGKLDLLSSVGRLFHGNGDGTFVERTAPFSGTSVLGMAFGDFDGDGHEDIAAGLSNRLRILYGDGAGGFPRTEDGNQTAGFLFAGNLDGDGADDLVLWNVETQVLLAAGGRAPCAVARACANAFELGDHCYDLAPQPGATHTCVGFSNQVLCLGDGASGQLGDGRAISSTTLTGPPASTTNILTFAAGDGFTCALDSSSGISCWGRNDHGQLGNGTTRDAATPVPVMGLSVGNSISNLAVGAAHACAIVQGGIVQCWGRNDDGQLGDGTTQDRSQPVTVDVSGVTEVHAGRAHTCARVGPSGIACWGRNVEGQLGDGTTAPRALRPVMVVGAPQLPSRWAVGGSHSCLIDQSGGVLCWGSNAQGQLGIDTAVVSSNIPRQPDRLTQLKASAESLALGADHTCISVTDSSRLVLGSPAVLCWGANQHGQLGDGTTTGRATAAAVQLRDAVMIREVIAGGDHTCGLVMDSLRHRSLGHACWGRNADGELTGPPGQDLLVPTAFSIP